MTDTSKPKYEMPPHPPATFYERVGRLCGAWSFFEAHTEQTVWRLLAIKRDAGQFITPQLDMKRRWEMLSEIVTERGSENDQRTIRGIAPKIGGFVRDRNLVVHGLVLAWKGKVCWAVFRGGLAAKPQPASEEFIDRLTNEVQAAAYQLKALNAEVGYFEDPIPPDA